MTELYFLSAEGVHDSLHKLLSSRLGAEIKIEKTANGKPYISGNPAYFSLSHSEDRAAIALSDTPVGVDLEVFRGRERKSVISRFSEREQTEISSERDFLKHWTAREAFIKLNDCSLAHMLGRMEFFGGEIYLDGQRQSVKIRHYYLDYGVAAVCQNHDVSGDKL